MSGLMLEKWAERIACDDSRKSSATKFHKLLEFLLHWRWLLEYNEADIRKTSTTAPFTTAPSATHMCLVHRDCDHPVWRCRAFKSMTVSQRYDIVKANDACSLCLEVGHGSSNCKMRFRCTSPGCRSAHNVLLHDYFSTVA